MDAKEMVEREERQIEILKKVMAETGFALAESDEGSQAGGFGQSRGSSGGEEGDDERVNGGRFDDEGDVEMED